MLSDYLYILKFFTFYSVAMVVFHNQLYKKVNLLFITFITAAIGLYLSFIKPRKFVVYFEKVRYVYTGFQKFIIVDMLFHVLAFYFIYMRHRNDYKTFFTQETLYAMLILMVYVSFTNTKKIYGVDFKELLGVFIISVILYWLIFHRK